MKNRNNPCFILFSIVCCIIFSNPNFAQNKEGVNSIKSDVKYTVWLYSTKRKLGSGDMYKTLDDSLILSKNDLLNLKTYAVKDIEEIQLRSKSKVKRGLVTGAAIGLFIGGLIGLLQPEDNPSYNSSSQFNFDLFRFNRTEKTIICGVTGLTLGTLVGGFNGRLKISVPINGDINKYRLVRDKLKSISKEKQ